MPELPEVETTVRGLATVLDGETLARVTVRRADLRRPFPVDLRQRLTGARVTSLSRRAKYGLIHFDRGVTMVFHLGMSGCWRIDQDEAKHDHLIFETVGGCRAALNDPRRFGSVDLFDTDCLGEAPMLAALGPEPLGADFSTAYLLAALKGRAAGIKSLLLDQRIIAGLGNIYVCEALHMAGIDPGNAGGSLSRLRLDRLVSCIKQVLESAIEAGGSTLKDFAAPDGELGYFYKQWRVYGREGAPCGCGQPVKRQVDGGRSTFFCPRCQR
jgi:formamidopyrimidine-DNA glycosylase